MLPSDASWAILLNENELGRESAMQKLTVEYRMETNSSKIARFKKHTFIFGLHNINKVTFFCSSDMYIA